MLDYQAILNFLYERLVGALTAGRSCVVVVINDTDSQLQLQQANHFHGGYAPNTQPQFVIQPRSYDGFGVQSTGFMTGVEGMLSYFMTGNSNSVTIHWNNPFVGSNSCDGTIQGA